MKSDQEQLRRVLANTLSLICKNGVTYQEELRIEGVIGITLDRNDVLIVHINDSYVSNGTKISVQTNPEAKSFTKNDASATGVSKGGEAAQGHIPSTAACQGQRQRGVMENRLIGDASLIEVSESKFASSDVTEDLMLEESTVEQQVDIGTLSFDAGSSLNAEQATVRQPSPSKQQTSMATVIKVTDASLDRSPGRHGCVVCGAQFSTIIKFKAHMWQEHDAQPEYHCKRCDKRFVYKSQYTLHMVSHPESDMHRCQWCSKSFSAESSLKLHLSSGVCRKEADQNVSESEVRMETPEAETLTDKPKKSACGMFYECAVCAAKFSLLLKFKQHMWNEHNARPELYCQQCDKRFGSEHRYAAHKDWHKCEVYQCGWCDQTFASQSSHRHHLKYAYCRSAGKNKTHKKTFSCDWCSKSFPWKSSLYNHMKNETCKKPGHQQSLTPHKSSRVIGKSTYTCDWCSKAFSWKSSRDLHMKNRTCWKVGYQQRHNKSMRRVRGTKTGYHKKAINHKPHHNNNMVHTCVWCSKAFLLKCHLYNHMKGKFCMKHLQQEGPPSQFGTEQRMLQTNTSSYTQLQASAGTYDQPLQYDANNYSLQAVADNLLPTDQDYMLEDDADRVVVKIEPGTPPPPASELLHGFDASLSAADAASDSLLFAVNGMLSSANSSSFSIGTTSSTIGAASSKIHTESFSMDTATSAACGASSSACSASSKIDTTSSTVVGRSSTVGTADKPHRSPLKYGGVVYKEAVVVLPKITYTMDDGRSVKLQQDTDVVVKVEPEELGVD